MIGVPSGTFCMGSGLDEYDWYADHLVTLTHPFWLATTETTHAQWEADPGNGPWTYRNAADADSPCTGEQLACPADALSWYDAAKYANWLSSEAGLEECYESDGTALLSNFEADLYACSGYRLPTEAEWEFAARAGQTTDFAGSDTAAEVAWTEENAALVGTFSHEVCSLASNAWGFCDMSGNLAEWANDGMIDDSGPFYATGDESQTDPVGPIGAADRRAIRGGSWCWAVESATVSARGDGSPNDSYQPIIGFRLVRSAVDR